MRKNLPLASPPSATQTADVIPSGLLARPLLWFLGCGFLIWLAFFAIWSSIPGILPGHEQIYAAAVEAVRSGSLFRENAETRLVIFGNSQIQSGFSPSIFDEQSDGRVSSYNLGIPATTAFVDQLEILVERDPAPTHILITKSWDETPAPALGGLMDDAWLMERLFPFKDLPRNLFLFLARSVTHGGPVKFYLESIANVEQSKIDRGYYFISGMSHFPDHRLPENFRLDSDTPTKINRREYRSEGEVLERIRAATSSLGIEVYFVPVLRRFGEFDESIRDEEGVTAMAKQGIHALGPDYWLLHNRYFSDPVHLNSDGARCFTTLLWELVGPVISRPEGSEVANFLPPVQTTPSCS